MHVGVGFRLRLEAFIVHVPSLLQKRRFPEVAIEHYGLFSGSGCLCRCSMACSIQIVSQLQSRPIR